MKSFKEEISRKYSLNFGYVVSCPIFPRIDNLPPTNSVKISNPNLVKEAKSGLRSPRKGRIDSRRKAKISFKEKPPVVTQAKQTNTDESPIESIANRCTHQNLSSDQAMNKLQRKLSAGGVNDELRPIAKGRAQFMLGHSKGKTRGLLNLYDTGCGGVLFREGVPQHELAPAVLRTKGPFVVKGVGDTTVKVNDEFMCTMSLRDGTRQVLEGWTVDKITATLPFVNLTTAESELKADKKENGELQELKCQPEVGGDCDILVGLMYSTIFPVAVHSLTNGLTIYKLKVTPHDERYDSVIGGPHESFQYMATQFGSMSIVFANLCQQLGNYQKFGPPKISSSLMTLEDVKFAEKFKEWEIENLEMEDIDSDTIDDNDYDAEATLEDDAEAALEDTTEEAMEESD